MSTLPHENVARIKYVLKPKHELTMPNKKIFSTKMAVRFKQLSMMLFALLIVGTNTLFAQQLTVKGRVLSAAGTAVSNASVLVRGTQTGTSTDSEGNFTINVAQGATLVFSAVNFKTKSVRVSSATNITVSLDAADQSLDEVVVVGYGTQRKRDVTGAVTTVSEKALREVPVANLQQALQGRAAGLEIQRVGNQPGSGAQIRIRGTRSITGSNEPLFVVDGIPYEGTLNDINPNDVASVEILKDASSTAIYGSRGANGVILVTTKKGKNSDTRISYNGYHGIGQVANNFPVYNAQEYQQLRSIIPNNPYPYLAPEVAGIAAGTNTNWQDVMYENALRTDHNISVVGGSNGNTFSLGGGYYKETTVLPGEDFTRYTLRATIDSRVGKKIRVGINTQNTVSISNGSQFVSGSPLFRMLALTPLTSPYDSAGKINITPWGNVDDLNGGDRYSPLFLKNNKDSWVDRVRRLRTFNTIYGEYEITKGLRYRANLGLNYAQQQSMQFRPGDLGPTNPSFFRPAPLNSVYTGLNNTASVDNGETWGYTFENLIYFDKTIKDKHKFNFTGLYSIQENQTYNTSVSKDSVDDNFIKSYALALSNAINSSNTTVGGGENRWALISYMARMNYTFKDKYLLTLTYRRDGSSRLAKGNNFFDYPAVSAGWILSDEPFLQKVNFVDNLKLRLGWGRTSNQAINPYQSLGLVNNNNGLGAPGNIIRYNFGPTQVSGYNVVSLPNPNLSWEFTTVSNLGIDFSLLKNKISGSVEFYRSKTNDILYTVSLPVTSGVAGNFLTNVGEMENKGIELSISTTNYTSPSGFTWSTDFNLFFNRNKLLKLTDNFSQDIGSQLFIGKPLSAIYDYKKLGIWQLNEAAEAAKYGAQPGMIKLQDYSGPNGVPDGVINNNFDRYVIGDGDADLQGGMTNRFNYKGFDLSTVLYARFGGNIISQIHQPNASFITANDGRRNQLKVDYWTPNNPTNWFPLPGQPLSPQSDAWRTLGYYSGTFVKLRSINLGYTFNQNTLSRMKAQNMRLYFTIDNVATLFSPYFNQTGIDPEGTAAGSRGVGNAVDNVRQGQNGTIVVGLGTPPRTTYTFGMNITL